MKVTYGFRGPERDDILEKSMLGFHDKVRQVTLLFVLKFCGQIRVNYLYKDVHVSPAAYNTEKYNQINGEVEPSK